MEWLGEERKRRKPRQTDSPPPPPLPIPVYYSNHQWREGGKEKEGGACLELSRVAADQEKELGLFFLSSST